VSKALREDLGRNGFTLESVTITELAQTPLAEMRADDIFGASGRETVTNTVVAKNIAVKRKVQEEAERTAEIAREQEVNVAAQNRIMREGKAREEEAAVKAEIAQQEAIQTRDLQRQAAISVEKARKEKTEQGAEIDRQKAIEAAKVDKEITLTLKAKESAEADAKRAEAVALKAQAEQQAVTVAQVAEAEREKQVAIVAAQKAAEQERIRAEVEAYKKRVEAEVAAQAVKIRAQAEADAAEKQAQSITRLAEANREAGLKEAEVQRQKLAAANSKSRELLLQETALRLLEVAPAVVRELVKPAERIGEIKVLQLGGVAANGAAGQAQLPLLGGALGPMMQTILQTSALMPAIKEMMKLVDLNAVTGAVSRAVQTVDPAKLASRAPLDAAVHVPEGHDDAH
jgi:flotillin